MDPSIYILSKTEPHYAQILAYVTFFPGVRTARGAFGWVEVADGELLASGGQVREALS
jgi:hypothetical protein